MIMAVLKIILSRFKVEVHVADSGSEPKPTSTIIFLSSRRAAGNGEYRNENLITKSCLVFSL